MGPAPMTDLMPPRFDCETRGRGSRDGEHDAKAVESDAADPGGGPARQDWMLCHHQTAMLISERE